MSAVSTTSLPLQFNREGYSDEQLLQLYKGILYPRLIEEKMLILLRQGRISKWFSGIGQEAIASGMTIALNSTDYIFPLHRNLGVWTNREMPLYKLFLQWQGKKEGYTKGRDRSFHFGSPEDRVIGMISHLGAMLPVADGVALASNRLFSIASLSGTARSPPRPGPAAGRSPWRARSGAAGTSPGPRRPHPAGPA